MGEESASITGGSGGGTGGGTTVGVPILDSEASSVSTKNWIVVGGSCVNIVKGIKNLPSFYVFPLIVKAYLVNCLRP